MPFRCHPKTTTKSIPYSISWGIGKMCTQIENRKNIGRTKTDITKK